MLARPHVFVGFGLLLEDSTNPANDMEVLVQQHPWSKQRRLYMVYILVAQHDKLKLINRAMIVKRCTITCNMLSNSLMVSQHTQRQLRLVLRPLKIVHHSCEQTKRCTTFARTVVCCIAVILIAFGRIWIVCMSTILMRLDATTKTDATNANNRATYATGRVKLTYFDCKVL